MSVKTITIDDIPLATDQEEKMGDRVVTLHANSIKSDS
jgi:hypothetical protein